MQLSLSLTDKHVRQVLEYGPNEGVDWVVLTNGKEIHLSVDHNYYVSPSYICSNRTRIASRKISMRVFFSVSPSDHF